MTSHVPFFAKQTLSSGTSFPESFCLQGTFGETVDISGLLSMVGINTKGCDSPGHPCHAPVEVGSEWLGKVGLGQWPCCVTPHLSGDQGESTKGHTHLPWLSPVLFSFDLSLGSEALVLCLREPVQTLRNPVVVLVCKPRKDSD